jgi:rod shape-determining protein MreC
VTHVTPHTGEVTLLSDRTVRVACEVERANGVRLRGILCGGTEDLLVLRHLTNAESATARSRVVTSGLGGVFPKGLEIGTLLDVRRDEKGLAREGEVLPSVDFSMLEDVFIRREK